jgi:hypothetical protein
MLLPPSSRSTVVAMTTGSAPRPQADAFAPRSLPARLTIPVEVYPDELHWLIRAIERRGEIAAEDPDMVGYADFLFRRAAALREASR